MEVVAARAVLVQFCKCRFRGIARNIVAVHSANHVSSSRPSRKRTPLIVASAGTSERAEPQSTTTGSPKAVEYGRDASSDARPSGASAAILRPASRLAEPSPPSQRHPRRWSGCATSSRSHYATEPCDNEVIDVADLEFDAVDPSATEPLPPRPRQIVCHWRSSAHGPSRAASSDKSLGDLKNCDHLHDRGRRRRAPLRTSSAAIGCADHA